jgi:hypothetical protein
MHSWNLIIARIQQGSILGLLFLFYINDLLLNFNSTVKSVLFADDISLVVSSYNNKQYINDVNITFARLNDWLNSNLLTCLNVKFLGIVIESSCTWKAHLAQLLPKLCKACF